jgi:type I restriction enzyme S subunit
LGDVVNLRGGKDYKHLSNGDIPVYGTGGYMLSVNEALSYDEDAIGIGRKGTIDKPYILSAPFWTVDTLFYAVPRENYDLDFVFNIFQNIDWKKKDESTGVPSLSKTAINSIEVRTPNYREQKTIGNYFATIDNLITLHQRKYEFLYRVFLCDIFAKLEEITPTWEQRKLGDIADQTYGGGTPRTSIDEFWNGDIPWIQSSDLTDGKVFGVIPNKWISVSGLKNSATKLVPENSIAIITRVGVGKLAIMPFAFATSQDFLSLCKLNIDPWFGVYSCYKKLQSELHAVQGTSIKGITKDELLEKEIFVPSIIEQEQIGQYFKNLDNLITLHQRKYNFF